MERKNPIHRSTINKSGSFEESRQSENIDTDVELKTYLLLVIVQEIIC